MMYELRQAILFKIAIAKIKEEKITATDIYDYFKETGLGKYKRNVFSSLMNLAEEKYISVVDNEIILNESGIDKAIKYVKKLEEECGSDDWEDIIVYLLEGKKVKNMKVDEDKSDDKDKKKKQKKKDDKPKKEIPVNL